MIDRDELLELIGKRMCKVYKRNLFLIDRLCSKQADSNFWQAAFYYNPNLVYGYKVFLDDVKLCALTEEYISKYTGVKARLMRNLFINTSGRNNEQPM